MTNKDLEVHPKGDVNRNLNRTAASIVGRRCGWRMVDLLITFPQLSLPMGVANS